MKQEDEVSTILTVIRNTASVESAFLLVFIHFSFLFSGCFEDEKAEAGETFFTKYVDGVSTVYADMEGQDTSGDQIIDNLGDMLFNINFGMLGNYGNGEFEISTC